MSADSSVWMGSFIPYETHTLTFFSVLVTTGLIIAKLFKDFNSPKGITTNSKATKNNLYDKQKSYDPDLIKSVGNDFIWDKTPGLKSYPFKDAEYKLTMGIRRLEPQDWLLIEPSYKKNLETKWKIVTNSHEAYPKDKDLQASTVFVTPEAIPAIEEFYDIVINYMCKKYPMYFEKVGDKVHNKITNEMVASSTSPDQKDPKQYLFDLVKVIEEDFIILLKDPDHQGEDDEYYFKGGIFGFASGFNPGDRFNKPLSFVHHPIPGYETKLKTSMNRFFNRIQKSQFVTRNNFTVQTHDLHYVDDQNKGHNKAKGTVVIPLKEEELDFDNQVFYRSERQVLTRLPKSNAVIFSIRTYLEPMSQFKQNGVEVSERLAGAIEKMPPDLAIYKNSVEWGQAVSSYLRRSD